MNKKGEEGLVLTTIIDYTLLVALAITLFAFMNNATNTEKYNSIRANDLGLAINSVPISKYDVELNYEMGDVDREVFFGNKVVKTYIDDASREREGDILIDNNYIFDTKDTKSNSLKISKKEDKVQVA